MKSTKLLVAGLVSASVLGLGVNTAMAATTTKVVPADTDAKITFEIVEDTDETVIDGPNPGGTIDPTGPGGNGNTDDENLKIKFVPNLDFGTLKYDPNNKQGYTVEAAKQTADIYDADGTKVETKQVNNFAQIWNSAKVTGWDFTVQMGDFEGADNNLSDLKVIFSNITVPNAADPYVGTNAVAANNVISLTSDNKPRKIGSLTGNSGLAINNFDFGQVTLSVPSGLTNIKDGASYVADLVWIATGEITE